MWRDELGRTTEERIALLFAFQQEKMRRSRAARKAVKTFYAEQPKARKIRLALERDRAKQGVMQNDSLRAEIADELARLNYFVFGSPGMHILPTVGDLL